MRRRVRSRKDPRDWGSKLKVDNEGRSRGVTCGSVFLPDPPLKDVAFYSIILFNMR